MPCKPRITIYHNPRCGTSRNTLGLIQDKGIEPKIIEYLKTPPSKEELIALLKKLKMKPRDLLRKKEKEYTELNLADTTVTDDQVIDAMIANPILIERPMVVVGAKAVLARPAEKVLEILP
jgi:arsenate reductase (glutaredoxin)